MLGRFAEVAAEIGARWGVNAAASLLAHLQPRVGAPAESRFDFDPYLIRLVNFGPLAWVEEGEAVMRPLRLTSWFVLEAQWLAITPAEGVRRLMRAAPEACLDEPGRVFAAVSRATNARVLDSPEKLRSAYPQAPLALEALAVAPRAQGRTLVSLASFEGAVGSLVLDVDQGTATLDAQHEEEWQPTWQE
jgi:hypothetical protein